MTDRLQGKVAIVTGAGSGIGRATARLFHREGASVVLADVTEEAKAVADELGERATAVQTDVRSRPQVEALVNAAADLYGGLHILANVAGVTGPPALLGDAADDTLDLVLDVNLRGPFYAMRAAIPVMLAGGGGSIVNVASMMGERAGPYLAPYCASKAALLMLTTTAAVEYAHTNIRFNCVNPGPIDTPLARSAPPEMYDQVVARVPVGRAGTPEEIANAVLFLASDEASFITAAALPVAGAYGVA